MEACQSSLRARTNNLSQNRYDVNTLFLRFLDFRKGKMVVSSEKGKPATNGLLNGMLWLFVWLMVIVSETTFGKTRLETELCLRPIKAGLRVQESGSSGHRKLVELILKRESFRLVGTCHLQSFFALQERLQQPDDEPHRRNECRL